MAQRILVGEDNHFNMDDTRNFLKENLPDFPLIEFRTEEEFYRIFNNLEDNPPVLAILGMRMRWTNPAPEMPTPPTDVITGTYRRAGSRCRKLLRQNKKTKNIPVVFYTVIDEKDNVEQEVLNDPLTTFVEMRGEDDDSLLVAIKNMLGQNA